MKTSLVVAFLGLISNFVSADSGIIGQVESAAGCSAKEVMVWLSLDKENYKERLLLMHTAVPVNGKFQFYLKPGNYQLRASDEEGCEFLSKIQIRQDVQTVKVSLRKK
jgi:hypothetical protein